jgi:hypothetical protein
MKEPSLLKKLLSEVIGSLKTDVKEQYSSVCQELEHFSCQTLVSQLYLIYSCEFSVWSSHKFELTIDFKCQGESTQIGRDSHTLNYKQMGLKYFCKLLTKLVLFCLLIIL